MNALFYFIYYLDPSYVNYIINFVIFEKLFFIAAVNFSVWQQRRSNANRNNIR